jgi:hypothetical protein
MQSYTYAGQPTDSQVTMYPLRLVIALLFPLRGCVVADYLAVPLRVEEEGYNHISLFSVADKGQQ